jgi:hypothetical protein
MALVLLMLLFSVLGLKQFIDLGMQNVKLALILPLLIGSIGIFINFIVGEIDRKKLVKTKTDRPYKFSFILSLGTIIFAIVLGGFMNPQALSSALSNFPYIAVGAVVFVLVALGILVFSTRGFSVNSKKEPLIV